MNLRHAPFPDLEQLRQLPLQHTMAVPPAWEDRNGHVNVQYYQRLYELGGYRILDEDGFDEAWMREQALGMFDLEHHICYRAEIRVGARVSCYNRVLALGARRFHGMYFITNDSSGQLACTLEYLTAAVDMNTRRTTAFPPQLHSMLERKLGRCQALPWPAPVCGVMAP